MSQPQNPPENQNELIEHDVTEIIARIEALEASRAETEKSIEELGASIDKLAEIVGS